MARPIPAMTAKQELFCRMSARGCSRAEKIKALWGVDITGMTPNQLQKYDQQMYRWRKHPYFDQVWKDEVRKVLYQAAGKSISVLEKQLDKDDVPWLQNKAANDLLAQGRQVIWGEEEKSLHITFEGMPEVGEPDADDG